MCICSLRSLDFSVLFVQFVTIWFELPDLVFPWTTWNLIIEALENTMQFLKMINNHGVWGAIMFSNSLDAHVAQIILNQSLMNLWHGQKKLNYLILIATARRGGWLRYRLLKAHQTKLTILVVQLVSVSMHGEAVH